MSRWTRARSYIGCGRSRTGSSVSVPWDRAANSLRRRTVIFWSGCVGQTGRRGRPPFSDSSGPTWRWRRATQAIEGYAADPGIPSRELIGGYQFDNVVLRPEEFIVVDEFPSSPYESD